MSNTEAYEGVRALLAESRDFTSGFGSVSIPFGFLRALTEQGTHVPDDVSLTGFDDIEFCQYTTPPLTTMRQDRVAIGRGAVQRLVAMLEGTEEASPLIVPTQLVVRKSTGPAPEEVH
jgi:LacI family transcriptional regulator